MTERENEEREEERQKKERKERLRGRERTIFFPELDMHGQLEIICPRFIISTPTNRFIRLNIVSTIARLSFFIGSI